MISYRRAQIEGAQASATAADVCRHLQHAMQAHLDQAPQPDPVVAHAEPNGYGGFRFWFVRRAR